MNGAFRLGATAASLRVAGGGGGDPFFSGVSLLLHFEGVNGSTAFTDSSSSPKSITALGNAQLSTAQFRFGAASGVFDRTDDALRSEVLADFGMGTGDFTVECFLRNNEAGLTATFFAFADGLGGSGNFFIQKDASNRLNFFDGSANLVGTATLDVGVWRHIAVCRSGSSIRSFVDGVLQATSTSALDLGTTRRVLIGGAPGLAAANRFFNGWIDEFRITKGVGRYTANFTPPSAPFPDA